jgi:hypothetical protein
MINGYRYGCLLLGRFQRLPTRHHFNATNKLKRHLSAIIFPSKPVPAYILNSLIPKLYGISISRRNVCLWNFSQEQMASYAHIPVSQERIHHQGQPSAPISLLF